MKCTNQAHFLYITTIRGCFICFLLPLLQVLYGITVTNVQLWPAIFLGNGVVNLAPDYCTTFLYPFTNVNRDCRHIQAAQTNLETLPNFAQTTSITEAATIFTKSRTKPVMRRCISHLPIQPPAWWRLPSDKITNGISFSQQLPAVFQLDESSRCSCGYNGSYDETLKMVEPLVIYTSTIAIQHSVETVYCNVCSNTHGKIGPDLGKYGILNWNNKLAFSHQLLNSYTS